MFCSTALQIFLDFNPDYWCFVPMKLLDINKVNNAIHRSVPRSTLLTTLKCSSLTLPGSLSIRTNDVAYRFMNNVQEPPLGFDYTDQQRKQQRTYFSQYFQGSSVPCNDVDLYNVDILAVCE